LEKETALCRLEGINCATRGRTGLTELIESKQMLVQTILGTVTATTTTTSATTTEEKENMEGEEKENMAGEEKENMDGEEKENMEGEEKENMEGEENMEVEENMEGEEKENMEGQDKKNMKGSEEKGVLNNITDIVLNAKTAKAIGGVANAIFDAGSDLANTKIAVVKELGNNLASMANEAVKVKWFLPSIKAVSIAFEVAANLTQAAAEGVFDVEVAAINATVNIVDAVVKTKTSLFQTVFKLLKAKVNHILCTFGVKC
jgi:hypothetical protein